MVSLEGEVQMKRGGEGKKNRELKGKGCASEKRARGKEKEIGKRKKDEGR